MTSDGTFLECATDDTAADETWIRAPASRLFKVWDAENLPFSNFMPQEILKDRGTHFLADGTTALALSGNDLSGNPRVVGSHVDIGCYEGPLSATIILLR